MAAWYRRSRNLLSGAELCPFRQIGKRDDHVIVEMALQRQHG